MQSDRPSIIFHLFGVITVIPLDPTEFTSNMRYFPRISPKFPQNSPHLLSRYSISKLYQGLSIHQNEIISWDFAGFNLIYWKHICGLYFLNSSPLEKCGNFWENGRFSGRIWPDWGNKHGRIWPDWGL